MMAMTTRSSISVKPLTPRCRSRRPTLLGSHDRALLQGAGLQAWRLLLVLNRGRARFPHWGRETTTSGCAASERNADWTGLNGRPTGGGDDPTGARERKEIVSEQRPGSSSPGPDVPPAGPRTHHPPPPRRRSRPRGRRSQRATSMVPGLRRRRKVQTFVSRALRVSATAPVWKPAFETSMWYCPPGPSRPRTRPARSTRPTPSARRGQDGCGRRRQGVPSRSTTTPRTCAVAPGPRHATRVGTGRGAALSRTRRSARALVATRTASSFGWWPQLHGDPVGARGHAQEREAAAGVAAHDAEVVQRDGRPGPGTPARVPDLPRMVPDAWPGAEGTRMIDGRSRTAPEVASRRPRSRPPRAGRPWAGPAVTERPTCLAGDERDQAPGGRSDEME